MHAGDDSATTLKFTMPTGFFEELINDAAERNMTPEDFLVHEK
jgi:hypothetical protein